MNWRKPAIHALLHLAGNKLPRFLNESRRWQWLSSEEVLSRQNKKLTELLLYSAANVPYYSEVLQDTGIVREGIVYLENFQALPILTKDIIREQGTRLVSSRKTRGQFYNTSGGSTGVPVKFLHDADYWDHCCADTVFYMEMNGKELGQKEIKFWGSERDLFGGTLGWKARAHNFLYNRMPLNSYSMADSDMERYLKLWNHARPTLVWSYIDSIQVFAQYIEQQKLPVHSPKTIMVTTGVLYENIRAYLENVFPGTKIINQYGSREVGAIACECPEQEGLHVMATNTKVEILNETAKTVPNGEMGDVIVSLLTNYAMPLLRYRIEDTAIPTSRSCSCGRGLPLIEKITGRTFAHFVKPDGSLVHAQYFVILLFNLDWLRRFQIVQKKVDRIVVRLDVTHAPLQKDLDSISSAIQKMMGAQCTVDFRIEDEIAPSPSGKFLYTVSEVERPTQPPT